jgi:hypothetical protein
MNALPSFEPLPSQPTAAAVKQPQQSRQQQRRREVNVASLQYRYRRQAVESVAKIVTYVGLSAVAAIGAINLINYNLTQQSKLHQLQTELKDVRQRSQAVDSDFRRSFDRQAPKTLMQENSYKIDPQLRPIAIVEPQTK